MRQIRLLIADDHALFREGLQALLAGIPDIDVLGEAATGAEAVELAEALQPDIVLMDVNMPGVNGVEATRQILAGQPGIGVVVVTMLEDDASVFAAMRAGARGYVLKGAHHEEMLTVIRAVAGGQALFGPAVARRLQRFFQSLGGQVRPLPDASIFPELTGREREVLDLLARGESNTAIAAQLGVVLKTVRNHVSNIFGKLQVADRSQAIKRAREAGLGEESTGEGTL